MAKKKNRGMASFEEARSVELTQEISLYDFLDSIGCNLLITRYANRQEKHWQVKIEDADVTAGGILVGTFGASKEANVAVWEYVRKIRGKVLKIKNRYYPVSSGLYLFKDTQQGI